MNKLVQSYYDNSRPKYCAKAGLVDEVVAMKDLRRYFVAFANCCYQNPASITPQHQMVAAQRFLVDDNLLGCGNRSTIG